MASCASGGRRPATSWSGCRSTRTAPTRKRSTSSTARARPTISASPPSHRAAILQKTDKPKVAILRDEGSNSDREMTSAFYSAGFEPWDVTMTDLLPAGSTWTGFRGLAAVGGFSYADVPESAKGWAATIRFNERLQAQFQEFYNRPDTFTLGICNGCQLFGLLGWVPWQGIEAERSRASSTTSAAASNRAGPRSRFCPARRSCSRAWRIWSSASMSITARASSTFPTRPSVSGSGRADGRRGLCRRRGPAHRGLPLQPQRLPRRPHRPLFTRRPPPGPDAPPGTDLPPLAGHWLPEEMNAYAWCVR
jgi:hypothetical protein